jgi:branched-chain amino acid transport system permease protein
MESYLIAIGIVTAIYVLLAIGLNLQYGFIGLVNFGHVAFFAIGAYTSALLALEGFPLGPSILAGAVLAALVGGPVSLLSLRLSDDYLAIVTLAFSETIRIVIQEEDWLTGGVQGLPAIPPLYPGLGDGAGLATLMTLVLCIVLVYLLLSYLVRSPYGRLIQAIRDDEAAVQVLGKNTSWLKVQVFMVGAGLAGLAGGFYAHFMSYLSAEQFVPLITFYVWIAIIIGGVGRMSGTIVGSVILMGFLEGSRFLRDFIPGIAEVQMASVRLGVVGLALILCTLYRPQGIMGRQPD